MARHFWKFQYPKDRDTEAPESRGIRRFFEILAARFVAFFLSGIVAAAALLPGAIGFFAFRDTVPVFAMLALSLSGLLSAPFYTAMCRLMHLALSSQAGYYGGQYKKFLKENWKSSLLPGAAFGFVLGVILIALRIFFSESSGFFIFCCVVTVDFALFLSVLASYTLCCSGGRKKGENRLLKAMRLLGEDIRRTLLSVVLQGAYWLCIYLLFPYSIYILAIFGIWFPAFLGAFPLFRCCAGQDKEKA